MNNNPVFIISENLGPHYNLYKTVGSIGNFRKVTSQNRACHIPGFGLLFLELKQLAGRPPLYCLSKGFSPKRSE